MNRSIEIASVKISVTTIPSAVNTILDWIKAGAKARVCVAPASTIVSCNQDEAYRRVINSADMVTPDGMPVVWMAKLKGEKAIERTYGPELMRTLCDQGRAHGLRHFFYGATPHTCDLLEEKLKTRFPGIKIVGKYSPGFSKEAVRETEAVIAQINASKADILWVGLGAPKQDFWVEMHRPLITVPVIVGIGAAFDFLSEQKPQAPAWMQKSGLEWLFRLMSEPGRLWKRYLIGNSLFIFYAGRDLWRHVWRSS